MNELYEFLRITLLFVGGLVVRALVVVLALSIYFIPVLLAWGVYKGYKALHRRQLGIEKVGDLELAKSLRYAPAHSWLSELRGGLLRMGLDDVAHRILSGITRVELTRPGTHVEKGETVATIQCGEKSCQIAAPVSGIVVEVNRALEDDPKWILREPYAKGWLFLVKPESDEFKKLRTGLEARAWFQSEGHRLTGFLDRELNLAAADGGELIAPPAALLPREKWDELTKSFLSVN